MFSVNHASKWAVCVFYSKKKKTNHALPMPLSFSSDIAKTFILRYKIAVEGRKWPPYVRVGFWNIWSMFIQIDIYFWSALLSNECGFIKAVVSEACHCFLLWLISWWALMSSCMQTPNQTKPWRSKWKQTTAFKCGRIGGCSVVWRTQLNIYITIWGRLQEELSAVFCSCVGGVMFVLL